MTILLILLVSEQNQVSSETADPKEDAKTGEVTDIIEEANEDYLPAGNKKKRRARVPLSNAEQHIAQNEKLCKEKKKSSP